MATSSSPPAAGRSEDALIIRLSDDKKASHHIFPLCGIDVLFPRAVPCVQERKARRRGGQWAFQKRAAVRNA
ncbi:hypothetical protein EJB05_10733, partial [Eragrostis curvula]